jgi:DNA-binding response OmpR family regulator
MEITKPRILLVEDDTNLAFVTKDTLEAKGYSVTHCSDGISCYEIFQKNEFDICLLDVMLPKMDGITLAEKIRTINKNIPLIFITAKSMLEDKLAGFKVGGDDYITKPFSIEELAFKIEVFLRRNQVVRESTDSQRVYEIGSYQIDFNNLVLRSKGTEQQLTLREGEVLNMLCQNQNEIVKREDLLKKIWGADDYYLGRSLDVFISRLRKYLKDDSSIQLTNIHSVGFKLVVK